MKFIQGVGDNGKAAYVAVNKIYFIEEVDDNTCAIWLAPYGSASRIITETSIEKLLEMVHAEIVYYRVPLNDNKNNNEKDKT